MKVGPQQHELGAAETEYASAWHMTTKLMIGAVNVQESLYSLGKVVATPHNQLYRDSRRN